MNLKEVRKRMTKGEKAFYKWAFNPVTKQYVLYGKTGKTILAVRQRYDAERVSRSLTGAGFRILTGVPVPE